jgi:hypothetical protein
MLFIICILLAMSLIELAEIFKGFGFTAYKLFWGGCMIKIVMLDFEY